MALSLNVIEHELAELGVVERACDENPSFEDVRLFAGTAADARYLYVCDAAGAPEAPVEAALLVVTPAEETAEGRAWARPYENSHREADGPVTRPYEGTCASITLALRTDASLLTVFTTLQDAFSRYTAWERAMDTSCLENEGAQALLDLSVPFLINHLVIVDPALKLLGTSKIDCDDPITMELIKHGYHTEANIRKFKLNKRFGPWATQDGFIINDTLKVCKYTTVVYSFKTRASFSLIIVMMCNNIDPAPWLLDVYRMFVERVRRYAERDYPADKPSGSAVDAFLRDVLSGALTDDAALRERSELVGIPYEARFCLFSIPQNDDAVPSLRLLSDVSRTVAPAKTLVVGDNVVVFCFNCHSDACARHCMAGSCPLKRKSISSRLNDLMNEFGLVCGRSSKFTLLAQAHTAFLQANEAANLARKYRGRTVGAATPKNWNHIVSFDRCCFDYLLECSIAGNGPSLARGNYACRILDEIAARDEAAGTDNYRFLFEYICNERRASVVAEKLHMHRNNVKYRIDRIEQVHDISVDDPQLRFDLALAYRIRESAVLQAPGTSS